MRTFLFCYEANDDRGSKCVGDSILSLSNLTVGPINWARKEIEDSINTEGRTGYKVNFRSITELDQPEDA